MSQLRTSVVVEEGRGWRGFGRVLIGGLRYAGICRLVRLGGWRRVWWEGRTGLPWLLWCKLMRKGSGVREVA